MFTTCGQLGPYILSNRTYSNLSLQYQESPSLGPTNVTWSGLYNLLNEYARSKSFFNGNTQFLSINVTWSEWYAYYLNSSNIVAWNINEMRTWANNYQTFLD